MGQAGCQLASAGIIALQSLGATQREQHLSWVSFGDRSRLDDPLVAMLEPPRDAESVPAVRGRAWGSLVAHAIRLLAWGEGLVPPGCGAVIWEEMLDFSHKLSTPGLAPLLQAGGCCRSGAANPALGVTGKEPAA